jgi:hypothetical protein
MGLTEKPWVRRFLVSAAGRGAFARFEKASQDVRQAQEGVLARILSSSRDTSFGKEHRFSTVRTIDEYRRAVPISGFEAHRPYIERMSRGEPDVLFSGKPLFYTTTSGTSDKPKLIPISKEYFTEYNAMTKIWLYSCLRDNPTLYHGKSVSLVAPAEEGTVEDGTPYGSISGVTYRNIPRVLKSTYATPYPVFCISDYRLKYYALSRTALEADVTFVISASPANVLRLHRGIMENFESAVRDIRDGTLRKDALCAIAPEAREAVRVSFRANPRRAAELEQLINANGENLRPRHYWPKLACVNVWKQGNLSLVMPKLAGYFPDAAAVREFGYWASEVRGGLVLGNDWDYSVLAAHAYFFEFIEEGDRQSANPTVLGAHELEEGKRYYIIFTNGSGLYRYDINDVVEMRGWYRTFPLFKFIRKGEGETNILGEKLTESQVVQAVQTVSQGAGIAVEFFTMFCDEPNLTYRLFVEFGKGVLREKKEKFAAMVDDQLRLINREYEAKRGSERLAGPVLAELVSNSYELFKEKMLSLGRGREGQYKVCYLRRQPELLAILRELA